MITFCAQCSIERFGDDRCDLSGLSTAEDTRQGRYPVVRCEDCGEIRVDHTGRRINAPRCQPLACVS